MPLLRRAVSDASREYTVPEHADPDRGYRDRTAGHDGPARHASGGDVHRAHRHLNPPENIRRRGRDACHKGVLDFGRYTTTERLGLLGVPLLCISRLW